MNKFAMQELPLVPKIHAHCTVLKYTVQISVGNIFNIVIPVLISCLPLSLYCLYFSFAFDGTENTVIYSELDFTLYRLMNSWYVRSFPMLWCERCFHFVIAWIIKETLSHLNVESCTCNLEWFSMHGALILVLHLLTHEAFKQSVYIASNAKKKYKSLLI